MLPIRCTTRHLAQSLGVPCLNADPAKRGFAVLQDSGHRPRIPILLVKPHRHSARPAPGGTRATLLPTRTRTPPVTRSPGAPCPWPDTWRIRPSRTGSSNSPHRRPRWPRTSGSGYQGCCVSTDAMSSGLRPEQPGGERRDLSYGSRRSGRWRRLAKDSSW